MDRKSIILLLVIIAVGAFVRSWNLESIPRWDWDEGVNLDIATNLAAGRLQWACLTYPFVPHPPLFFMLVAAAVKLFGSSLLVERGLTASFGVVSGVFVYLIGRRLFGLKAGLLAGLLYALYPSAAYFNRIGFANNLIILLLVLCMYSFVRYLDERKKLWLYLSAACAGLSAITEIQGFCTVAALMLLLWVYDRKSVLAAAACSLAFFAIFVAVMLNIMHDAFIADAFYSSGRFNFAAAFIATALVGLFAFKPVRSKRLRKVLLDIYGPVFDEVGRNPIIYVILFVLSAAIAFLPPSDDFFFVGFDYHWVGLVGFLLMKDSRSKNIVGVFFLVFFIALLGFDRADHMLMPLYPLLSLGLGVLFSGFFDFSVSFFRSGKGNSSFALVLAAALLAAPMLAMVYYDFGMFVNGNWIDREDTQARASVADYLNKNTAEGDVVIVDSHLTRMVAARPTVLVQSAAFDGHAVEFIRPDYGRSRFLADCSYRNAKFVAIANNTLGGIRNESGFDELMAGIGSWPTREIDGFLVYSNPSSGLV